MKGVYANSTLIADVTKDNIQVTDGYINSICGYPTTRNGRTYKFNKTNLSKILEGDERNAGLQQILITVKDDSELTNINRFTLIPTENVESAYNSYVKVKFAGKTKVVEFLLYVHSIDTQSSSYGYDYSLETQGRLSYFQFDMDIPYAFMVKGSVSVSSLQLNGKIDSTEFNYVCPTDSGKSLLSRYANTSGYAKLAGDCNNIGIKSIPELHLRKVTYRTEPVGSVNYSCAAFDAPSGLYVLFIRSESTQSNQTNHITKFSVYKCESFFDADELLNNLSRSNMQTLTNDYLDYENLSVSGTGCDFIRDGRIVINILDLSRLNAIDNSDLYFYKNNGNLESRGIPFDENSTHYIKYIGVLSAQ